MLFRQGQVPANVACLPMSFRSKDQVEAAHFCLWCGAQQGPAVLPSQHRLSRKVQLAAGWGFSPLLHPDPSLGAFMGASWPSSHSAMMSAHHCHLSRAGGTGQASALLSRLPLWCHFTGRETSSQRAPNMRVEGQVHRYSAMVPGPLPPSSLLWSGWLQAFRRPRFFRTFPSPHRGAVGAKEPLEQH